MAAPQLKRIAVIADFLEERWPSMDLAAEQLVTHLSELDYVRGVLVRPPLRTALSEGMPSALERALGRFGQFPLELAAWRGRADFFHVADHSYGHLALLFPRERVGVYCHDIDAYRALLPGSRASRSRRALSRLLLAGLRHARVVFHSTACVRQEILQYGLVPAARLVQAPLGVATEFLLATAQSSQRRYLLHVGSCIPRKNVELLLRIFASVRKTVPGLELVQVGGSFTAVQREYIERERLSPVIDQRRGISRTELAGLYAGASAVLVPSLAEGFGIPVIEALACGAPVVASDIPVLREVGIEGTEFCPLNDLDQWTRVVAQICESRTRPSLAARDRVRARYTWLAQASTVASAYLHAPPQVDRHSPV